MIAWFSASDGLRVYDDILIASKGSLNEHKAILKNILTILDNKNMAVKWEKCAFFQKEIERLGFKISNLGVKPLVGNHL